MMRIDILSLFPEMFGYLNQSILGKAQDKGILDIHLHNFRDYATNKQHHADDYPYGGETAGMLLMPQPIFDNMDAIEVESAGLKKRVILLDPAGVPFTQTVAEDLATAEQLVFICGHYEGYDERIRTLVTDEISLGDYVLTGGELGAMVIVDAVSRLLPEVLGNKQSAATDSHSTGLLEEPQYTRPAEFRGMKVPDILLSGDHAKIKRWRMKESLRRTLQRRPDMLANLELSQEQEKMLAEIKSEENLSE